MVAIWSPLRISVNGGGMVMRRPGDKRKTGWASLLAQIRSMLNSHHTFAEASGKAATAIAGGWEGGWR